MIEAELNRKISHNTEKREDLLTSNVFSFFKYTNRAIYLRSLLEKLEIYVSKNDLITSKFEFWPEYEDGTVPDLTLVVGKYYILFEAKYFSDFGQKTANSESQLKREIKEGIKEANRLNCIFCIVLVTNDFVYRRQVLDTIAVKDRKYIRWIYWQDIAKILLSSIKLKIGTKPENVYINDLYDLLDKKKLRGFHSFNQIIGSQIKSVKENIFLKIETTVFRNTFLGFTKTLSSLPLQYKPPPIIFPRRHYFKQLKALKIYSRKFIFIKEAYLS